MCACTQTRRGFLQAAGVGAVALADVSLTGLAAEPTPGEVTPPARGPAARRLNLVLIVADDQRSDTIASRGNDHIHTPHLDALAKVGFTFTAARCMGAQNAAVCVPARAMLHTGRSLFRAPENMGTFTTLGQALRAAGYETFHAGKWHNGTPAFVRSFSSGAHIFFGGMHSNQYKMPIHDFDPAGRYDKSTLQTGDKFSSELFADAAVEFISRQAAGGKPFFCHLAFSSPHDPRTPPPPYSTMYDPAKMPLPDNWLPRHPLDNGELNVRDEKLAPMPRTPADTRQQLCDYYGMISSQDEQVGRVLAALKTARLLADTLVIYTGDHGLSIGSHGLFGKQNVYEEAQRVPLIFSGPGIPVGKTSGAAVYGFDIYPTIGELLGLPQNSSIDGRSLTPVIQGVAERVRDTLFGAYIHRDPGRPPATQHAVCEGQWKLIHYHVKGKITTQLFDLANVPHETHDLAHDAAATNRLPRLLDLLTQSQRDLEEPRELRGA